VLLLDPNRDALAKALAAAGGQGLLSRVVTVIGGAGNMPLPEARSRDAFERLAREAGLKLFNVLGEGGLDEDDPDAGAGIRLRFSKEE